MELRELVDLSGAVSGASFSQPAEDRLAVTRRDDGVVATVRLLPGTTYGGARAEDVVAVVRWVVPRPSDAVTLSRINAAASFAVATSKRYENLYGRSAQTFHRAQLLAAPLEPERFLAALARDLGLQTSLRPPPSVSLDDVQRRLSRAPVKTPEQRLMDAMFGPGADAPAAFERRGDHLVGPSSIGHSARDRSIPVEVRVCDLGLVHVRHTAPARPGDDAHAQADAINAEDSADEACVGYARAFSPDGVAVTVEITASLAELDTELFRRKIADLERSVSAYLRPPDEPQASTGTPDDLFAFFTPPKR